MTTHGTHRARPSRRPAVQRWITARRLAVATGVLLIAGLVWAPFPADAATAPVGLGTADDYSVLGGQTVTNAGSTTLSDNLGVSPGTAITGFPPGTANGDTHAGDAVAAQAQLDLVAAYNDAAGRPLTADIAGDLGGLTFTDGVYKASSSIFITGAVTLDAQGDPDAVFIFQIPSTLITASASSVSLINGAKACQVFWQVGSSATLGTTTSFVGTIMALTSISVNTGAVVQGRALARNGQVSLQSNTFVTENCADQVPTTTSTTTTTTTTTTTEPTTTTSTTTTEPTTTTSTTTTEPTTTTTTGPTSTTTTGPTSTATGSSDTITTVTNPATTSGVGTGITSGGGGGRGGGSDLSDTGPSPVLGRLLGLGSVLLVLGGLLFLTGRNRQRVE